MIGCPGLRGLNAGAEHGLGLRGLNAGAEHGRRLSRQSGARR